MRPLTLNCYCCGELIPLSQLVLVSMSQDVDRVFAWKKDHMPRMDKDAFVLVWPQ